MPVTMHGGSVRVVRVDWVADDQGDATEVVHIDGTITRLATIPGADGLAPTADYDITLVDEDGLDILGGLGADRHTSNSESAVPTSAIAHYGPVTFTVANAGDSNAGTAKIYYR